MKKILTYVTFCAVLFPQYLFAGNWFCSGNTSVCGEADLRLSVSGLAKIGFFLLLFAYLVGFFIEAANQYSINQFEGPAFYQFLKKRLTLFVVMLGILVLIANFQTILVALGIDKQVMSMYNSLIGSK